LQTIEGFIASPLALAPSLATHQALAVLLY